VITTVPNVGDEAADVMVTSVTSYTMLGVKTDDLKKLVDVDASKQIDITKQPIVDYGLDKAVFNLAIKQLPRKYKQRRNQLRFFAGSNLVQDYLYNLTNTGGNFLPFDISSGILRGEVAANDGGPGTTTPFAFGIPVINVPLMDETLAYEGTARSNDTTTGALHGDLHLTFPQNFIVGIKRDVTVYRLFQPKKDTIEYTLFIRVGCVLENYDAHVLVKNVRVSGTGTVYATVPQGSNFGSLYNGSGTTDPNFFKGSNTNFTPSNTPGGLGTF
jgi:hypothetical protein